MRKFTILFLLFFILISSCIPVKVAPKFKNQDYRISTARKFKRKLPRETSFIFKDPKNDGEFYTYLNTKFQLNDNNVGQNTPIIINGETYYLSYIETEKEDKSVKVPLVLIDAKRQSNGNSPLFDDNYVKRKGHWYLLINIYDENLKNCLLDNYPKRQIIENYLVSLKAEYLNTANYEELLLNKKP